MMPCPSQLSAYQSKSNTFQSWLSRSIVGSLSVDISHGRWALLLCMITLHELGTTERSAFSPGLLPRLLVMRYCVYPAAARLRNGRSCCYAPFFFSFAPPLAGSKVAHRRVISHPQLQPPTEPDAALRHSYRRPGQRGPSQSQTRNF